MPTCRTSPESSMAMWAMRSEARLANVKIARLPSYNQPMLQLHRCSERLCSPPAGRHRSPAWRSGRHTWRPASPPGPSSCSNRAPSTPCSAPAPSSQGVTHDARASQLRVHEGYRQHHCCLFRGCNGGRRPAKLAQSASLTHL